VRPALDTERRGRLRDDIARVTQDLATAFELLISDAPEQWHLFQPNWPSDYEVLGLPMPEHLSKLLAEDA
jgi:phosphatidylinositol dimannoside acyltransferase